MWLTLTVRPKEKGSDQGAGNAAARISNVSPTDLATIASRLEPITDKSPAASTAHQLVRFNVYNFGEQPVTLYSIALKTIAGDKLSLELVRSLVVQAGARQPLLAEVTVGPVAEAVDIEVDDSIGQRYWLPAQFLPAL